MILVKAPAAHRADCRQMHSAPTHSDAPRLRPLLKALYCIPASSQQDVSREGFFLTACREAVTLRPSRNWSDSMSAEPSLTCRSCGHPIEARPWGGGECSACGSVSVAVVPSADELSQFYAAFNQTYHGGGRSGGVNLQRYAQRYLDVLRRYSRSGRLIDVGCSRSPFPNMAARDGFEVTAMDYVLPEGLDQRVTFLTGSLEDEAILANHTASFDVVTAWAVLEHVPDPGRAARILAGLCRPGGVICLSTAEIGTLLTRYSIGRSGWFKPPMHLHLVAPSAMGPLFQDHGCTLIRWGRLELSPLRYLARYGIGVVEAFLGAPVKALVPSTWQRLRDSKVHRFRGISYFVLKKAGVDGDGELADLPVQ